MEQMPDKPAIGGVTRELFVDRYMKSWTTCYLIGGERVYIGDRDKVVVHLALPCRCGEDGCEGWAMIAEYSRNWHMFQNGLTDMSGHDAMDADAEWRRKNP